MTRIRRCGFGLLSGLFLSGAIGSISADRVAAADQEEVSSKAPQPDEEGPERLKQQVRISVETNVVSRASETNLASGSKSFQWKAEWRGWNGLHFELTRKTLLGMALQEFTHPESETGTNLPASTRLFHLEEARMTARIGARLAVDGATYITGNQFQDFNSGAELRRAFVFARGDCLILLPFSYSVQVGYNANQFFLDETYVKIPNIPVIGDLKGGGFKAPMSLDQLTSSRDITLMEPAAPTQALAPGNSAGVQIGRAVFDQRATWTLGIFTDGVGFDYGDASKNYGRAIMRITGVPLLTKGEDGSQRLLHLGLSANFLYSDSSTVRYRARPESHLAPTVVDTGDISAEGALAIGGEVAWVNGPFSIQGEVMHSWVHETDGEIPNFGGFYATASWFLTGESRPYVRTEGIFGRVRPHHNFNFCGDGWGAWELAARVSYLDLDSEDIHGGRLAMLMTGVNWYLNPNLKWRFDYGFGQVRDRAPEGDINIFQTRIEVDF